MRPHLYFFLLVFLTTQLNAQESAKETSPASINGTIENQFDYVMQKSNNFQEYKVVDRDFLNLLKKNSVDSIARFKNEVIELKAKFSTHDSVVKDLNDSLQIVQAELKQLKSAQNNVDFFGTPLSKTSYNLIMWGLVFVLFVLLIVIGFQLKGAASTAKVAREELIKTEEEFEDYKRKALEKEQKLGRQLQDEVNKQNKPKK